MMDDVKVQLYDAFSQGSQAYLGSADIVVGFASAKKRTEKPYDQDELAHEVIRVSLTLLSLCSHCSPGRAECFESVLRKRKTV